MIASQMSSDVAAVTGGGRGIGRAIVERFLDQGLTVHSIDLAHPEPRSDHPRLFEKQCDITSSTAVASLFRDTGPIDVLVNNAAAFTRSAEIADITDEEWQQALSVNLTGMFNVTKAVLATMPNGARIINMASTFAHVGMRGRLLYSATKGGIVAFTRSLALDVASRRIRVNSVSPGATNTERLAELFSSSEAAEERLRPLHPLGRTGLPGDIAAAVWFLASSESAFMTGSDLRVDGGYTAQ